MKINNLFNAKMQMINKVRSILLNFFSLWSAYAPLITVSGMLDDIYNLLTAEEQTQLEGTTGFTNAKRVALVNMATTALPIANKVRAFAKASGNETLFNLMSIPKSQLLYGKELVIQGLCQVIYDNANAMLAPDKTKYNITANELTGLSKSIVSFGDAKHAQNSAKSLLKANRKMMTDNMNKATALMDEQMDSLIQNFAGKDDFVLAYKSARRIDSPATQNASLAVTLFNKITKEPIANGVGNAHGLFQDIAITTDSAGKYKTDGVYPELLNVEFNIPGYKGYSGSIKTAAGKHRKLIIRLEPNTQA